MQHSKDIAIYGAGGFGREIACLVEMVNKAMKEERWNLVGFFDDSLEAGQTNEYGKVLGGMAALNGWPSPLSVVIAIGSPTAIEKVVKGIVNPNIEYPNIIAPNVEFLDKDNVKLGKGNIICSDCFISCNVTLGDFNAINGGVRIGHDTSIGNCNAIMPSCNISGGVQMGNGCFMGVKSVVLQFLKVGNHVRIGANSLLMRNAKDDKLYMGSPAKKIEV